MKFKLNKMLIFKLGASHVINSRLMYNNLKEDEFARSRTTILGKRGFRHLFTFALFITIGILLINWGYNYVQAGKIIMGILLFFLSIYPLVYSFMFLPIAINLTIKQLKLNKKAIGYINLVIMILILLAIVGLILLLKII